MFDSVTSKFRALGHKLSAAKPVYPSKTTMNLAQVEEETTTSTPVVVTVFVIAMIAILAFAKFGVVDMLARANQAQSEVSALQAQIAELQESSKDYAELKAELDRYSAPGMTEDEATYANREHAIAVADAVSGLGSQLQSISMSGNTLQIQMVDTDLATVSDVVAKIRKVKWVESVQPNTAANTEDSKKITATITVGLVPAAGGSTANGSDASSALSAKGGE